MASGGPGDRPAPLLLPLRQLQSGELNPLKRYFSSSRVQRLHADALHLYRAIPHHGLARPTPRAQARTAPPSPALPDARPRPSPHRAGTAAAGASSPPGRGRQTLLPSPPSWKWARTLTAATRRAASRRQSGRVYFIGLGAVRLLLARDGRREAGVCGAGVQAKEEGEFVRGGSRARPGLTGLLGPTLILRPLVSAPGAVPGLPGEARARDHRGQGPACGGIPDAGARLVPPSFRVKPGAGIGIASLLRAICVTLGLLQGTWRKARSLGEPGVTGCPFEPGT